MNMAKKGISIDTITGKDLSPELKNLYAKGIEYKNVAHDYPNAIACFQKVVQEAPNYMFAHYLMGMTYADMKDWEKVIPCFERVNELVDDEGDAHLLIGYAYQQLGKYKESIPAFRKAAEIGLKDSQPAHLYYFWAISERMNALKDDSPSFTNFEPAIAAINKALNLQKTAQNFMEKAHILFEMQCYFDAINLYKTVEKNKQTQPEMLVEARMGLARSNAALDNYAEALKWIGKVLKDYPQTKSAVALATQHPIFNKMRERSSSAAEKLAKLLA
jgi:tetratricopeptide (TPR) repeat protein